MMADHPSLQYGYSELSDISHYSVKVMCAELLFAEKDNSNSRIVDMKW